MLNPRRADTTGESAVKATTIDAQSEMVMGISQSIFSELDGFLNGQNEAKELNSIPKPQTDSLSQIAEKLYKTETTFNKISEQISKLKARIR